MIVLIEDGGSRMVFDNVTRIEEESKPSVFGGDRKVVNLYSVDQVLMGGDDIDLMTSKITILPNAEKENK
jgi:hypothetical protein